MEEIRFRIEFYHEKIIQKLINLPKSAQILIKKAVKERLEIDPIKLGKPLVGSKRGMKRLRISIYRIIYKVDADSKIVTIMDIDYRRDVYD